MDNFTAIAECERSFGPTATVCSDRFDFTLLFEQSVLNIGPSAVLLLVLPFRLQQLCRQRRKVLRHPLNAAKIAACLVFGGLQVALLTLWTKAPLSNQTSIAASVLGVLDAFALGVLSYTEHTRTIRPSSTICLYLVFSLLFDAVQCRTLWLLPGLHDLSVAFTAMLSVKFVMFLLEIKGKRRFLMTAFQSLSPEATSGIVSRGFFWWLNGLLGMGFKATLSPSTLYVVDDELRSDRLLQRISGYWDEKSGGKERSLWFSLCKKTKTAFFLTAIPRLALIGFKCSQPFLINRVIRYVDGDRGFDPKSFGYGLIAATGLVYLGNALSMGFYQHRLFRFITMIRGSLVSLIMSKNLEIVPNGSVDSSAPLTLVSTDVRTICKSFEAIHEVWANPIEIGIAIWLLQRQLGLGSIGPAITIFACTVGTAKLSKLMPRASKIWNEEIQKRITVTSDVLGSIKEAKMLGMVALLQQAIQDLRISELARAKRYRALITYMNMLGNTPSMVGPVVTFGIAILAQKINAGLSLSTATVFTSLSIIGLISQPLAQLIASVPVLVSSLGSFERIQAFLDQSTATSTIVTQRGPLSVDRTGHGTFQHGEGFEMDAVSGQARPTPRDIALIQNGNFSLKPGAEPVLRSINLRIKSSTMTIIIGRVGSGKTTLLRGLLGELSSNGSVRTLGGAVAYCAQTSWLTTSTIKDNILGETAFDEDWYEKVLQACALVRDFAQLRHGDQTVVGSKGQSLSEGQKQRVALARAVYSRKPVLVVDDALSGLDVATRNHVWNGLFEPAGLVRQYGASVILTTHSLDYLSSADNVVILGDDGRIANQGTFESIRSSTYLENLSIDINRRHDNATSSGDIDPLESKKQDRPPKNDAEIDPEQDLLRRAGDTTLYLYYFKSIGWQYGSVGGIFLVLNCFVNVFPQLWLKFWTEDDARTGSADTAMYFGVYFAISMVGLLIIGVNIWIMFVVIVPKSSRNMHWTLLQSVMRAPLSFFVSTDTGNLINRFSQDLSHIDRDLPSALFMTSIAVLDCLAEGVLIVIGAKYLAVAIPFVLGILYCLQAFYLRTSRQMRFLDLQAQAPLLTKLIETIDGLSTIRAFGWQEAYKRASLDLLDQAQRPYYLLFCIQRWLTLVLDLLVGAIAVLLVSIAMMIPDATSTGAIAVALYNVLSFNRSLAHLITSWTELETSLGAISRLRTFEAQTPVEPSPSEEDSVQLRPHWPAHGQIEITNTTASYSVDSRPVLNSISLSINPGDKIAIRGRTGSGKSSLILAIFKLLGLDSGSIVIDGIDIARVPNNLLRQRLIAIPQEPLLFPGSLRINLFPYGDDLSAEDIPPDETLIDALRKVSLWSIISLHGGLGAEISDLPLSKGQKQLLCLARAIVRKNRSRVLVLDEATSAVDQETEEMMTGIIQAEFATHTVISVVHRPQALRGFGKVVTLHEGRVAEIKLVGC
ncbi:Putative AAA+ ATPase domain, ABC transporter type 1, transmembrane domain-containing protein [Colletotrichum destructivum]|uniref:AAA+ ATPase domain, ABC transporter type 1, transmembrane domain-containing protein n=1 Tax=Colletotrichum destructivum TaxID=34406 RepID=A0AAX4IMS1_9PEZI|nr:Putative AAA+ ATPase domain, ABC transporter type 1, transmembrane domain-containing protein [Colletotrichum destructivum]